jgi:hypothetical protein
MGCIGLAAAPWAAAAYQRRREYLANITVSDELTKLLKLWSDAHLCTYCRDNALRLSEFGQFSRLGQAITKRPFTMDVLARIQRGGHQFAVMRHLDGDDNQIDLGRIDERLRTLECMRQTKCFGGQGWSA